MATGEPAGGSGGPRVAGREETIVRKWETREGDRAVFDSRLASTLSGRARRPKTGVCITVY